MSNSFNFTTSFLLVSTPFLILNYFASYLRISFFDILLFHNRNFSSSFYVFSRGSLYLTILYLIYIIIEIRPTLFLYLHRNFLNLFLIHFHKLCNTFSFCHFCCKPISFHNCSVIFLVSFS